MKVFLIGGVIENDTHYQNKENLQILKKCAKIIGTKLMKEGHDLLVCSPFEDSIDYHAVLGTSNIKETRSKNAAYLEFHYPDNPGVDSSVRNLINTLNIDQVRLFSHGRVSESSNNEAQKYSWVLAQLNALEHCNVVVTLGGREDGSAALLLRIAEAQRKPILPFRFLGGVASRFYDRLQYELHDRLGDQLPILNDPEKVSEIVPLIESLTTSMLSSPDSSKPLEFFISYARSRPGEADYVETLLRRRNFTVYRDEEDFQPGSQTYEEIRQHIFKASVFIAIWCAEYACSPWCFDELDIALNRNAENKMALWIITVDKTRIVPPKARGLTFLNGHSREEIEASIRHFLEQVERTKVRENSTPLPDK